MQPDKADWGPVSPHTAGFRGRQIELTRLRSELAGSARVVSITGAGGMGKSSLAKVFALQSGDLFDLVCWCDFRDLCPAAQALDRILRLLAPVSPSPADDDALLASVTDLLRTRRALVVLDNLETVMQPGEQVGLFEQSHQLLERLIERVAAEATGALLLTSREKPHVVETLEGAEEPVRSMGLNGVGMADAIEILVRDGLSRGEQEDLETLAEHHGRNPYALRIVAVALNSGDQPGGLSRYIKSGCPLPSGLEELLDHQYSRLSELERICLLRATAHRLPIADVLLAAELDFKYRPATVRKAVKRLRERGLVEGRADALDLQNVLREYCTSRLVEEIGAELMREEIGAELARGEVSRARDIALISPGAPEYIRDAQRSLLSVPVARRLEKALSSQLASHLKSTLDSLRGRPAVEIGYAGGTVVNILIDAESSLAGADLSNLVLWRCQLDATELHGADGRGSDFADSQFSNTFGEVTVAMFSPDGTRLAAGTSDGSVRIWDTQTWLERRIPAHDGYVRDVVIPDSAGEAIVTAGDDGAVRCWNAASTELEQELSRADSGVASLAYDRDAGTLAAGRDNGSLEFWDLHGHRHLGASSVHRARVRGLAFAASAGFISADETGVICTTVIRGDRVTTSVVCEVSTVVWFLEVSPDGSIMALGGPSGNVWLLSVPAFAQAGDPIEGSGSPVWSAAFSSDSERLYVATSSGDVLIASLADHAVTGALRAHKDWVRTVALHGRMLATGAADRTVRLWNTETTEREHTFRGYNRSLWAVAFSEDGAWLAAGGSDGSIHLWNAESQYVERLVGERWIRCLAFHPSLPLLAVGDDGGLRVRDVDAGRWHDLAFDTCPVWGVAFSGDGERLASAGEDCTVRCWDIVRKGKRGAPRFSRRRAPVRRHANWVVSVAFHPDGHMLASGDADGAVLIGPLDGPVRQLQAEHAGQVWALEFLSDRAHLIAGGRDGVVRQWRYLEDPPELKEWTLGRFIWAFAPAHRGSGVYLAGDGGQISELDGRAGEVRPALREGTDYRIHALSQHPRRPVLASAGDDGLVRIWNLDTGREEETLDPDRLYARFNITGARNIADVQRTSLIDLGAVDDEAAPVHSDSPPSGVSADNARQGRAVPGHFANEQGSVIVQTGDHHYTVGQAGIVGPGAKVENMHFAQTWSKECEGIDLSALATELKRVREELSVDTNDADGAIALGYLAEAELAAQGGDGPQALEHLSRVGRLPGVGTWALGAATAIGTSVAAQALRVALGV